MRGQPIEKTGSQIAGYLREVVRTRTSIRREEFTYVPRNRLLGISADPIVRSKKVTGAVAVFQDLTAAREMEERKHELEREKYWNTIAFRLSHELKNPLVAIKTFAQILPEKYEDDEFRTHFSRTVQSEVDKLDRIVEKINRLAEMQHLKIMSFDAQELLKLSLIHI